MLQQNDFYLNWREHLVFTWFDFPYFTTSYQLILFSICPERNRTFLPDLASIVISIEPSHDQTLRASLLQQPLFKKYLGWLAHWSCYTLSRSQEQRTLNHFPSVMPFSHSASQQLSRHQQKFQLSLSLFKVTDLLSTHLLTYPFSSISDSKRILFWVK